MLEGNDGELTHRNGKRAFTESNMTTAHNNLIHSPTGICFPPCYRRRRRWLVEGLA